MLRSALEKIVFFECKVAQLESELAAARQESARARADAAQLRERETELTRRLATESGARTALTLRETDLRARVELLEAERERLLGGLVERGQLGGASGADGEEGPDADGADLAGFIAELRAEIETLRAWKAAAEAEGRQPAASRPVVARSAPTGPAALSELGRGFEAAGRTGLSPANAGELAASLSSRADRALYQRAMDELANGQAPARTRAIRQLAALSPRATAPVLASALAREQDAGVKVSLLDALGRLGEPFAADLAVRELEDARPEVRAAALTMLSTIAEQAALPRLSRALSDPSALVRRRAAVLLGFARGEVAEGALAAALRDGDAGVARAAAAALSGRGGETARRALERHAQKLPRTAVASPMPSVPPPARQGALPAPVVRNSPSSSPSPRPRGAVAVLELPLPALAAEAEPATTGGPTGERLEAALLLELRGALRGRTAEELYRVAGASPFRVDAALQVLLARGAVVARGPRWCMA